MVLLVIINSKGGFFAQLSSPQGRDICKHSQLGEFPYQCASLQISKSIILRRASLENEASSKLSVKQTNPIMGWRFTS